MENRGPDRFGSSRKKEAAGAAHSEALSMGFECRFFERLSGDLGSGGSWSCFGARVALPILMKSAAKVAASGQ